MENKIGFIGAGNMAGAIIEGLSAKGSKQSPQFSKLCDLFVYDVNKEKLEFFSRRGITAVCSVEELVKSADIVFLSVKPQNYEEVLLAIRACKNTNEKVFVSIAAGISTDYIRSVLGVNTKVVRAMPNTPILLSLGATALCKGENVSDSDFEKTKSIFECSGIAQVLPEDKMNAVIAVNGSSPAYIYLLAKAVIDGASNYGIDKEVALNLFAKTLEGSAQMLMSSGFSPQELIDMVSSKGGTTIAALNTLNEFNFSKTVIDAMQSCVNRAEEIGR